MSFDATVLKVLIASPADVSEERKNIPLIIAKWNRLNAETTKIVLLPVKWETHSAPLLGDRPQGIVNNQVVTTCDMAIGVFGTRLGSPTGVSESGTAEEIEWFLDNNKPVMLYFSSRPIDPQKLDIVQYTALKEFEKKMQKLGLTGSYTSIEDLGEQLLNQISINVSNLLSGATISTPTPEAAKIKQETIKKIAKQGQIYMEDYSKDGQVKSFLVKGDTKSIKEDLRSLGGKWNSSLKGWIFPKGREIEIAEFIKKA